MALDRVMTDSRRLRCEHRSMLSITIAILCAVFAAEATRPAAVAQEPAASERLALTVPKVMELLRAGTPAASVLRLIKAQGGDFDLTIEDVVRLGRMGAPAEVIRAMAAGGAAASPDSNAGAEGVWQAVEPAPLPPGELSLKKILRMHRKGDSVGDIAAAVASRGLSEPIDLDRILALGEEGLSADLLRVIAGGSLNVAAVDGRPSGDPDPAVPGAAAHTAGAAGVAQAGTVGSSARGRMTVDEVLALLSGGQPSEQLAGLVLGRGVDKPPSLEQVLSLRAAGATDALMAGINRAVGGGAAAAFDAGPGTASAGDPAGATESQEDSDLEESDDADAAVDDLVAVPASELERRRVGRAPAPTPLDEDRVWIGSIPSGARVYVSPGRTRLADAFSQGYFAGRTPVSLVLPPGEYHVVVQKEAGTFEEGLLPAWRTVHDTEATRSILDDADLTFDPNDCCLPGSLSGTVQVRPLSSGGTRAIVGDEFDGLPPYLFDGESLQVLRVRDTRITHVMKLYDIRKRAGRSRILIAAFRPAEGDPLDPNSIEGVSGADTFGPMLDVTGLSWLTQPDALADLADALRLDPAHLGDGIAMLRRAGKAILHQQEEAGLRLISFAVDDDERLRLSEQTIRPKDPLPSQEQPARRRKKAQAPPPEPPPLPALERIVVPGLGHPRLEILNDSTDGIGLLFDDGRFYFVPGETRREFVVEPGTFQVRAIAPQSAPSPAGRLHFSYHARYRISF